MKNRNILISALSFLRSIACYTLFAFLFVAFFFRPMQISGTSMTPTLHDDDKVLINVFHNLISEPQRFDVVVARHDDELWIKRVIGLPGETVSYREDTLYVDGQPVEEFFLDEAYMNEALQQLNIEVFTADVGEIILGKDEYLLVGDNRPQSLDSRSAQVGTFKRSDIIANGVFVFWPLNEVRYIG